MTDKELNLKKAMAELEKKYKRPVVVRGGMEEIKRLSTKLSTLDNLFGGGLPRTRWTMIYGDSSVGKTTFCYYIVNLQQKEKKDSKVLIIDAEHSWEPDYASEFGMDPDNYYYNRPDTLEEAMSIIRKLAPFMDLIIVDSITSVASESEIEREMEQDTMALTARRLSQFFRVTTPTIGKSNAVVILVNQLRTAGLGGLFTYDTFPGGHALKHNCSMIVQMMRGSKDDRPKEKIDGKMVEVGFGMKFKVQKTKVSKTEGQETILNYYTQAPHFSPYDDAFKTGVLKGVITRGGAWYEYDEIKTQGGDAFLQELKENDKVFKKLQKELSKCEN